MKLFCVIVVNLMLTSAFSQSIDTLKKKKHLKLIFLDSFNDSAKKYNHFELSFGQNLLFIPYSRQAAILSQESIVIPTSAVLFFLEFRPHRVLRIPLFLNIATESKQFLVNSQIVNEKASPTIGTGLVFKVMQLEVDTKSRIEVEMGALGSIIYDNKNNVRAAPVAAMRLKICRGENFVMYLGGNYSFGIKAFGMMYGTGTFF
jgi:hypothetical protein